MKKNFKVTLIVFLVVIFGCFSNVSAQDTRAVKYNNKLNEKHCTLNSLMNDKPKKHDTDINKLPTLNGKGIDRNKVLDKKSGTLKLNSLTDNELPISWDNSTSPYFPPILNQGGENDCSVISNVYYQASFMESQVNNKKIVLSPQFVYNLGNKGFEEGVSDPDIFDILKKHGCATIQSFPYLGTVTPMTNYLKWPTNPDVWRDAINHRIEDYRTFDINTYLDPTKPMYTDPNDYNLQIVKNVILKGYTPSFSTNILGWNYAKTNTNEPICTAISSNGQGWHGMCIVGYDDNIWTDINGNGKLDSGEKGAFKVINPWGTDWGQTGGSPFCWLSYDALNKVSAVSGAPNVQNRIVAFANGVNDTTNDIDTILPKKNYSPKYLVSTTISDTKYRDDLSVYIRIKNSYTGKTVAEMEPHVPNEKHSSSGYTFDGTETPCSCTFVFDITDQVSQIDASELSNYYVSIEFDYNDPSNRNDFSTVTDVKLMDGNSHIIKEDIVPKQPTYANPKYSDLFF